MQLILYRINPIYQNHVILNRDKLLFNIKNTNFQNKYFIKKDFVKFLEISKKLKDEIEKDLNNVTIGKTYKDLINEDFDKICKYLYELCFEKKEHNDEFLKFLLLLDEKYPNNHELSFLIRFLIDKCNTEIFFKILLYNRLLIEIFLGETSSNYDFFFHNPNFNRYKKKFSNLLTILSKQINRFYNNSPVYENYELTLEAEDTVAPILKQISYCYFFDKFKKRCDAFLNDSKSMKIIKQELKDKYIGTEKWINQYNLYKNIKILFNNLDVKIFREFSPPSMGLQRLDIYIEINNQKVGFEYQGEQHYKPVDFFGGEEGFKKRQQLDKRKKDICRKLNIKLIKFKFTESVSINSIIKKMSERNVKFECGNTFLNYKY